jgi:hypothetical protein
MIKEDISFGSARILQLMTLMFFISFVSFATYIILTKNPTLGGFVFILCCFVAGWLFIYQTMLYGDLTIDDEKLIVKKITYSKAYQLTDIKIVDEALLRYTFYIEFENSKKIYFRNFSNWDMKKTVIELRIKLNCIKNGNS